jgi:SP family sugar:H+ symporter-like MFS transporter
MGVVVTYFSPYIQDAGYGNLQGKIGFVWGSGSIIAILFVFFYIPELKGRTIEELDEMFDKKVSVWSFGKYERTGVGRRIMEIEDLSEVPVIQGKETIHNATEVGTKDEVKV